MPVDDWIERKVAAAQKSLVRALVGAACKEVPNASLSIKWGQPVFELNGPVAFIKPAKAHVTFGFWRGAQLNDPHGLLEGGEVMRHLKLRAVSDITRFGVAKFLREAVALNRAQGDPTRVRKKA